MKLVEEREGLILLGETGWEREVGGDLKEIRWEIASSRLEDCRESRERRYMAGLVFFDREEICCFTAFFSVEKLFFALKLVI